MEIKTARTLLTVSAREWWWRKEKSLSRALASLVCYRIILRKKINGCRQARSRQGRMIFGPVEVTTLTSMILDRQMKTQNLTVHYT